MLLGFPAIALGTSFMIYNKHTHDAPHFTSWHGVCSIVHLAAQILTHTDETEVWPRCNDLDCVPDQRRIGDGLVRRSCIRWRGQSKGSLQVSSASVPWTKVQTWYLLTCGLVGCQVTYYCRGFWSRCILRERGQNGWLITLHLLHHWSPILLHLQLFSYPYTLEWGKNHLHSGWSRSNSIIFLRTFKMRFHWLISWLYLLLVSLLLPSSVLACTLYLVSI